MINSQYRKPLPGTTLDYFDTEEAIEALAPGSYRKLPYTSKVLAENLVRRCDPSLLDCTCRVRIRHLPHRMFIKQEDYMSSEIEKTIRRQ